jgi:hypothetical protein
VARSGEPRRGPPRLLGRLGDADCTAVLADDAINAPTLNPGGTDTFQFCMDVPPSAIPGGQLSVEPTMSFDDERVFYAVQ